MAQLSHVSGVGSVSVPDGETREHVLRGYAFTQGKAVVRRWRSSREDWCSGNTAGLSDTYSYLVLVQCFCLMESRLEN